MVNEIWNFILVRFYTRLSSSWSLLKPFSPRVYLSRFNSFIWKAQLIPRCHPVTTNIYDSIVNFEETIPLSRGISLDAKLYESKCIASILSILSDRENDRQ